MQSKHLIIQYVCRYGKWLPTIHSNAFHLCPVHLLQQGEGVRHQDLLTALPQQDLTRDKAG